MNEPYEEVCVMRTRISITLTLLLFFVLFSAHAEAGLVKDMQLRIDNLQKRIDSSLESRRIGHKRATELNKTLNSIRTKFNKVKHNPILFAVEKPKLVKKLDSLDKEVPPLEVHAPPQVKKKTRPR
jgi:septal ring factor EnvC (AmiA/AmiB activator)